MHSLPNSHQLIARKIFREDFKLVVPKAFIKTKQLWGKALFSKLVSLPCIGYKAEDEVISRIAAVFGHDIRALNLSRITANYESIVEMVHAQLGWSVVPSYLEVNNDKNWIIPVPKELSQSREFYLVYRSEFQGTVWFKDLLGEIQRCF